MLGLQQKMISQGVWIPAFAGMTPWFTAKNIESNNNDPIPGYRP